MVTNNVNISSLSALPSPAQIRREFMLSPELEAQVLQSRAGVCDILEGRSHRAMMIVGPCSIHNLEAAHEYARRLTALAAEVSSELLVIMRCYFEKPRTTVGWKGLITDPDLNDSCNIAKGIRLSRSLMLDVIRLGLPVATEMLDPMLAQYIADCVSWTAIGARTTEAQTHRQLASGLSMPVGFKNATDGSFQTALDAMTAARCCHSFIGLMEDGTVGVFRTCGNRHTHIVLRGGAGHTNFGPEHVAYLKVLLQRIGVVPRIVVDCSHANSDKDYRRQHLALESVLEQWKNGEDSICGVMLESNLSEGCQPLKRGEKPLPDVSVTDGCIGWEETARLVRAAYEVHKKIHRS